MTQTNDTDDLRTTVEMTGGDGKLYSVPAIKAKEFISGRAVNVAIADLSVFPKDKYGISCQRCGGGWDRDQRTAFGGWLPKILKRDGCWYETETPCPDCAFGAYRKMQDLRRPFFTGWSGCSRLDLGYLIRLLHNDKVRAPKTATLTLREALDSLREPERRPKHGSGPDFYIDLHERLLAGIEQQELVEQYPPASGRDRQGADAF